MSDRSQESHMQESVHDQLPLPSIVSQDPHCQSESDHSKAATPATIAATPITSTIASFEAPDLADAVEVEAVAVLVPVLVSEFAAAEDALVGLETAAGADVELEVAAVAAAAALLVPAGLPFTPLLPPDRVQSWPLGQHSQP